MGLFDRFSKVISSNMNALLDKAEDPQKSVDYLIEEMREQIRKGRQEVVQAVAAEKRLRAKVDEIDEQIAKWQRRAELAVQAGDENLAKEALLFKKKLVGERDRAEALRAEQRSQALQLKDDLERADAKLKELDAKKGTIVARYQQARAGGGAEALGARGDGPTPFDELRRMEEKMDRAQTEAEAMKEARDALERPADGRMTQGELEARFEQLEKGDSVDKSSSSGDDDVDDELRALRNKYRITS